MSIVLPPTLDEAKALVLYLEACFPGKSLEGIARSAWAKAFMESGVPTKDIRMAIQSMISTEEFRPGPAKVLKVALVKETAALEERVEAVIRFVERHGMDRAGEEMEADGAHASRALWRSIGGASWSNRNSTPDDLRKRLRRAAS